MSIRGSCLCGELTYEVTGPYDFSWHCHCSQCRRAHGAAFGSYAGVKPENFKWLSGEDLLKTYELDEGGFCFCSQCGSNVAGTWNGVIIAVTFGSMEGDPEIYPDQHIYVGSKASWATIDDGLPESDEYPVVAIDQ
ncbi:MAG: hypothetical protein ACI822_003104 [Gammaproteobacteria bacterium]|jgi:hypothetical protein